MPVPDLVPSGLRLGLWQHRLRGSREVGVLLAQAASSSAQRHVALAWRPLHMLDARSFMISHSLRSQVSFAAAVAHARLRLSRLELIGGSGRTAGRYASAARAFISYSPTAFEQARGGALGAGGGRVGFTGGGLFLVGRGEHLALGLRLLSRPRIRGGYGLRAVVRMCSSWVWIVVRFVCVIRVPVCARVSRVCPGPGVPATTAPPS